MSPKKQKRQTFLTNAERNAKLLNKSMAAQHSTHKNKEAGLFDDWPERYDQWFTTPIGALIKKFESELVLDLLRPNPGETILDAGCGTGIFSLDILAFGTRMIGIDISLPMLLRAAQKAKEYYFQPLLADLSNLPFPDNMFDKVVSVTALEFIGNGKRAIRELFRVTRRHGTVVMATLNSLSPWATRRKAEAKKGHPLFQKAIFRSPEALLSLAPVKGMVRTAIHFEKDENPNRAPAIEFEGQRKGLMTGAFMAARWEKS